MRLFAAACCLALSGAAAGYDGCVFGPCGLAAQLLIRISPPGADAGAAGECPAPPAQPAG